MVDTLIAHLFVVFFSKSLLPGQQCHSSACCLFVPSVYCVKKQMLLECFAYVYSNFTLYELMTLLQSCLLLNMLIFTVHCKKMVLECFAYVYSNFTPFELMAVLQSCFF
jgi:hypothetical protein